MPSQKQYRERKDNIASILRYIRAHGGSSRRQLCKELGLSWGCVSELVSILLQQNILREEDAVSTGTKGRSPAVLRLNPDICFLGVDINLNGLRACVCNLLGEKTADYSGVLRLSNKDAFLSSVIGFAKEAVQKHPGISGIGFAIQGIFDPGRNEWEFPAQKPFTVDLNQAFTGHFSVPITIEHDPNCILYGCLEDDKASKMVLRLDSGIGAAVYTQSAFLRSGLLEVGHLVMDTQGRRLHEIVSLQAMRKHNADDAYFREAGFYLGTALGNICNLLRLDEIYLCGDMIGYYSRFENAMLAQYSRVVLPAQSARISAVEVTDAAYGAAKMAMDNF